MILSNKKGTHVGMILSFLIFVTFLAFLYSITEPATQVRQDKLDALAYLKTEIIDFFSDNITSITIDNSGKGCFKFPFEELDGLGAIAKKVMLGEETGEVEIPIDSLTDDEGRITIQAVQGKIKFYYSDNFEKDMGEGCDGSIAQDYEVVLFRTSMQIFESKIINAVEMIKENPDYYDELKKELGLALDDEFGFSFLGEDRNPIAGTEEKEVNIDIYSEEVPIQYIDWEANIKPGFLVVKIW